MKPTILWTIGAGAVGIALGVFVFRGHQASSRGAMPAEAQSAQPAGTETVAYTFADEAKMREFTDLWQQRQSFVVRMTVLQNYWNSEQSVLAKLNNDLQATYGLDVSKNYTLDSDKRQLIERAAPEPQVPVGGEALPAASSGPEATAPDTAPPPAAAGPASSGEAPQVVHTFSSDEELKVFAGLWQQRQAVIVRMAVLQAYAKEEQAGLAKLNDALTTAYHLDSTKDYFLDSRRRVLLERPTPPAPPQP